MDEPTFESVAVELEERASADGQVAARLQIASNIAGASFHNGAMKACREAAALLRERAPVVRVEREALVALLRTEVRAAFGIDDAHDITLGLMADDILAHLGTPAAQPASEPAPDRNERIAELLRLLAEQGDDDMRNARRNDGSGLAASVALAMREHVAALCRAMELWGAQEDGVPDSDSDDDMGRIGRAYDAAKGALATWPMKPASEPAQPAEGVSDAVSHAVAGAYDQGYRACRSAHGYSRACCVYAGLRAAFDAAQVVPRAELEAMRAERDTLDAALKSAAEEVREKLGAGYVLHANLAAATARAEKAEADCAVLTRAVRSVREERDRVWRERDAANARTEAAEARLMSAETARDSYASAIGQIEGALGYAGARPVADTVDDVKRFVAILRDANNRCDAALAKLDALGSRETAERVIRLQCSVVPNVALNNFAVNAMQRALCTVLDQPSPRAETTPDQPAKRSACSACRNCGGRGGHYEPSIAHTDTWVSCECTVRKAPAPRAERDVDAELDALREAEPQTRLAFLITIQKAIEAAAERIGAAKVDDFLLFIATAMAGDAAARYVGRTDLLEPRSISAMAKALSASKAVG